MEEDGDEWRKLKERGIRMMMDEWRKLKERGTRNVQMITTTSVPL
jgi:hypothetical protein